MNNLDEFDLDFWNWLNMFMEIHSKFSDLGMLYNTKDLREEDIKNIKLIRELFNRIDDYAIDNLILMKKEIFGGYYTIKVNGSYYDIGHSESMSDSTYFCRKNNNPDNYINYEDIINNKPVSNKEVIIKLLKDVKEHFQALQRMGVSHSSVYEYVTTHDEKTSSL